MSECHADCPVILTGMPRSGTTMLNEFAREYLDMASINEGPFELWLVRQSGREASLADDAALRAFLHELAGHLYFQILFRGHPPLAEIAEALRAHLDERTIPGIGRAVLVFTRDRCGNKILGHEDPALMNDPSAVVKVFPTCRILHILRDPRDAAASILKFPWGANNVYIYASEWRKKVASLRRLGRTLGAHRYLEVKYEDIMMYPERAMRAMMQLVQCGVDADRLAAFIRAMENNPRRNNFGKWKRSLTVDQVGLIEGAAWDEMIECGYEPAHERRTISLPESCYWRFHHRSIQVRRILAGELKPSGSARPYFRPEHEEYAELA